MNNNSRGRNRLSRRLFLGGSAVVVGLPFLESVMPSTAEAAITSSPKRLLYVWIPNGIWMDNFRPTEVGEGYKMPPSLAALEPHRADFSIVTGLNNSPAQPDQAGDHASGTSGFITCIHALKSATDIRLGISADQIAAQSLVERGIRTRLPSLQLGIDGGGTAGGCDSGYSCAYSRNISWSDATTPQPKITNPQQAFNRIFEGYDPNASAADVAKRQAYDKSVLDYVTADIGSLNAKLGKTDRVKLDQYLTGVRALEQQLTNTSSSSCMKGTTPSDKIADYPSHVKSMLDLMVLAFQCDATRVTTFMLGNAGSNQTYPFLTAEGKPINRAHHEISHHGGNTTNIAQLIAINTWTFERVAYLLEKMKAVTEGPNGENMLTNSSVFVSSDVSDGNMHNHSDMPIILAGHGGGMFNPGRHIRYGVPLSAPSWKSKPTPSDVPVANLLLSTLQTVGATTLKGKPVTLGDGTGPLTEL